MSCYTKPQKVATLTMPVAANATMPLFAHPLADEHEREVLEFLDARSIDTTYMTSLIRDNGLESPFNRGTFYAARDRAGQLSGVALIGHAMLIAARDEAACSVFARLARDYRQAHVIMGEEKKIGCFWRYYAREGQRPRVVCRELLFEQQNPVRPLAHVAGLRPATLDDLSLVLPVQASMAFEESGVDPLEVDPCGFRLRLARRIEQERVWVWIENGRLIFKADIMAETPRMIYLEGIHVDPQARCLDYGLRCLSQLDRMLLRRTESIALLVNEQNKRARAFYHRAGYKLRGYYDTIFLEQPEYSLETFDDLKRD